jgi:hypothetical protein
LLKNVVASAVAGVKLRGIVAEADLFEHPRAGAIEHLRELSGWLCIGA